MSKICSFCKREVTNDVCCDYCGTPLIFSEDEEKSSGFIDEKITKNTEKIESIENSTAVDLKQDDDEFSFHSSDIKELYNRSMYLRDKTSDSIFENVSDNAADALLDESSKNIEKTAEDDIKISIYNSDATENAFSNDGDTKIITGADIELIRNSIKHKEESEHLPEGNRSFESEINTEQDLYAEDNVTELDENSVLDVEVNDEIGNLQNEEELRINEAEKEERYAHYTEMLQNSQQIRREDTKVTKFLGKLLGIMFLAGLVCLFFPSLNPTEATDTLSFSIIDTVLLVTTFAGMCFAFFEKKGIRKFIYGIMFSLVFAAVYTVFVRPIPPKSIKEIGTVLYIAIMLIASICGHISAGGTSNEKLQVWFDTFSYLALIVNVFAIALAVVLWFVIPSDIMLYLKPYVISVMAICLFSLVGVILMMRRKIAGANMYLMSAIAIIAVSMLAYNKVINTIGYYSSVVSLMSAIGSGYSKFIALCVAYPIFMYFALVYVNSKSDNAQ